ncbi:hypothetical protein [Citricoccus sp. GCM10030269]|uniref:hypothetical protein n=1 Tax=Citricoccus sp. GCM10030269 TaxID=3273388 RepID=UPI0036081D1C
MDERQNQNDDPTSDPTPEPPPGPGPAPTYPPAWGSPAGQSPYGAYGQPAGPPLSQQNPYGYSPQPGYGKPSRRPGIIPLTPLALGDLLGASFAAIRRNAAAVLGTALIVALVQILVSVFAATTFFNVAQDVVLMEQSGQNPFRGDPSTNPVFGQIFGSMGLALLGALVSSLAGLLANGVLSIVVLRSAAGLKTSLGQAWKLTGQQIWSLIGIGAFYLLAGAVTLVLYLGVMVGLFVAVSSSDGGMAGLMGLLLVLLTIGMVVLWVWLYVKLLLAPAAAAVELKGPWKAFGRSWSLTRGHWWRTFGIVLLVAVIVGVVSSVITTPISMISGLSAPFAPTDSAQQMLDASRLWMTITVAVTGLVNALAMAYMACLMALLYVDYRIRHESFDLDLAAAADAAGMSDDDRFSTVRDVQAAAGIEDLVPGRHQPAGSPGQDNGPAQFGKSGQHGQHGQHGF